MKKRPLLISLLLLLLAGVWVLPDRLTAQTDVRGYDPRLLLVALKQRVVGMELNRQLNFTLLNHLDTSLAALELNNIPAAIGPLRAFQGEVRAKSRISGPIFGYDADSLVGQAEVIVTVTINLEFINPATPDDLLYLGGTVLRFPKVYVTYWGWGPGYSDPDGEIPVLTGFLQGIGGTAYLEPMTQYYMLDNGVKGHIHNDPNMLAGVWFDDTNKLPAFVDTPAIENEVRKAAKHFGATYDGIYFIATPKGRAWDPNGPCAYHASTGSGVGAISVNGVVYKSVAYVDFPYQPEVCQIELSASSVTSVIAFHELIEAMNDPRYSDNPTPPKGTPVTDYPSNFGWLDKNGAELGDLCGTLQGWPAKAITLDDGSSYAIQAQWSNVNHTCVYSWP